MHSLQMHVHCSAALSHSGDETKQYREEMRRKRVRADEREQMKVARRKQGQPSRGSSLEQLGTRRYPQEVVLANARDRSRRAPTAVKRFTLDFGPASKFSSGTRYPGTRYLGTQDDRYPDSDGYSDPDPYPQDLNLDSARRQNPPRAARDAARGQNQTGPKFGQLNRPDMHDSSDSTLREDCTKFSTGADTDGRTKFTTNGKRLRPPLSLGDPKQFILSRSMQLAFRIFL